MLPCIASWAFSYITKHFLKKLFALKEETPCCPVCAAPITLRSDEDPASYEDRVYDINKRGKAGNLIVEQVLDRGIWKPKVTKELRLKMRAGAENGLKGGGERMQRVAAWKEKRNGGVAVEGDSKAEPISV